jgi:ribosomal-protein-serine acetyltransferase
MLPLRLDESCVLRLVEDSDARELAALVDANRAYLSRWMPWAPGTNVDTTRDFIRQAQEQAKRDDGFQAIIECDGRITGVVGFHRVDRANRSTSIGYWIAEPAQGRGTMTKAVGAMIDIALSDWGLNRVEIRCAPENTRSRAIPERLGFREEATLRQAERIGDRYLDNVVYSMLASEWREAGG